MMESALVVGSVPATTVQVAVSEHAPTVAGDRGGQTVQRVKLLLYSGERLSPPMRLLLRGAELRIIGTQVPPFGGLPAIVTCERINPDLPDLVIIIEVGEQVLNESTGRLEAAETPRWSGATSVMTVVLLAVWKTA